MPEGFSMMKINLFIKLNMLAQETALSGSHGAVYMKDI